MSLDTTLGVTQLGHYRLLRRLAVGGMAELFVAVAEGSGEFAKPVAIKRILPQLASDRDFVRMFFEEAKLAASLDHPHIAKVIDFGEQGGLPYLVMEFVRGVDLRGLLSAVRSRLPIEVAATIIVQLAEALHYMHEHSDVHTGRPLGLVHRDVTPSNVLLGYSGGVKLTDFGIVKATEITAYTATESLKGKLPYLAPEQGRCERLDRRTDIYALGLILFELTTGRRMHRAESEVGLLARVCDGEYLPPSTIDAEYDSDLESIVAKALQPLASDRYQTAKELAHALEKLASRRGWSLSTGELCDFIASSVTAPDPVVVRSSAGPISPASSVAQSVGPAPRKGRRLAVASALAGVGLGAAVALGFTAGAREPDRTPPALETIAPPAEAAVAEVQPAPERPDDALQAADVERKPVEAGARTPASEPEAKPPKPHSSRASRRSGKKRRPKKRPPADTAPDLNPRLLPPSQRQ